MFLDPVDRPRARSGVQILREAWRLNRDFFYAPNYHGIDWNAMWNKYEPFLDHAATRSGVIRIIAAMASELRVGHSYSGDGESIAKPPIAGIGLLGADFESRRTAAIASGRCSADWTGGRNLQRAAARCARDRPSAAAGEYLLAVDGKPLTDRRSNVYERVSRTWPIKPGRASAVGPRRRWRRARARCKVVPVVERAAAALRGLGGRGNLRKVDAATGGRVAYVHVPDTSVAGHASFKRYFFPQSHKEALILDERNNGGGFVADYVIDTLRKQPVIRWATRYGKDLRTPRAAIYGPKVMISNEGAGSGGDLLPWMFRKLQLGTIVGTRTWGGLVGNLEIHTLMDGGTIHGAEHRGLDAGRRLGDRERGRAAGYRGRGLAAVHDCGPRSAAGESDRGRARGAAGTAGDAAAAAGVSEARHFNG